MVDSELQGAVGARALLGPRVLGLLRRTRGICTVIHIILGLTILTLAVHSCSRVCSAIMFSGFIMLQIFSVNVWLTVLRFEKKCDVLGFSRYTPFFGCEYPPS